ncbi:MAG: hypothetical protein WAU38_13755 [Ignavibacteria bacterium]
MIIFPKQGGGGHFNVTPVFRPLSENSKMKSEPINENKTIEITAAIVKFLMLTFSSENMIG